MSESLTKSRGPKIIKIYLSNTLRCLLYAESCLYGRAHIRRRSADTNLVETHKEMSELLDKQVYVLNECFFQIKILEFTRGYTGLRTGYAPAVFLQTGPCMHRSPHTLFVLKWGYRPPQPHVVYIGANLYDPSVILLLSTLYRFIGRCVIGRPVSARVQQFTKVAQAGGFGGTPMSTASILHTYIHISLSPASSQLPTPQALKQKNPATKLGSLLVCLPAISKRLFQCITEGE